MMMLNRIEETCISQSFDPKHYLYLSISYNLIYTISTLSFVVSLLNFVSRWCRILVFFSFSLLFSIQREWVLFEINSFVFERELFAWIIFRDQEENILSVFDIEHLFQRKEINFVQIPLNLSFTLWIFHWRYWVSLLSYAEIFSLL
jgi:hypothetical protein